MDQHADEPNAPGGATSKREDEPSRLLFRRRQRLGHAREFQAVYAARVRKARSGIIVFGMPNRLGHSRLGLSVGRSFGGAVARNRVKRLLREAFRLEQAEIPAGYDFVISVRPHRIMGLPMYRRLLVELSRQLVGEWGRRERRADGTAAAGE